MAERVIAARKSQLFLHTVIPVTKTHDEVVQDKLKKGKFPWTVTGCIKLAGIVLLLPAVAIFLSTKKCDDAPEWRTYLFPITTCLLALNTLIMYFIFSFGLTVKKPSLYVKIDIIETLLLSVLEIASAIATMFNCTGTQVLKRVPEAIGIAGAAVLIGSCASLVMMYRYREFEDDFVITPENPQAAVNENRNKFSAKYLSRKSIAA